MVAVNSPAITQILQFVAAKNLESEVKITNQTQSNSCYLQPFPKIDVTDLEDIRAYSHRVSASASIHNYRSNIQIK